jgi:hypothetical protein
MKTKLASFFALAVCAFLAGCNSKQSAGGGEGADAPPVTPARQTSFAEVTKQLDPSGTMYGYLATDQWLAGLSTKVGKFRELLLGLPDVSVEDAKGINLAFDVLTKAIARSGLENFTGVGLSGLQVTPELHRAKLVLHHGEGHNDGLIWEIFGKAPHAFTGVDLLTTNTALAAFGDLDATAIWRAFEKGFGESGVPELSDGIKKWPAEFEKEAKLSWDEFLASLGGEMGVVLTLDPAHRVGIPIGNEGAEIPTPGVLFIVKVNNDLLFDRIAEELKKNESTKFTEEAGLKMYAMPMPIPLPLELQITLARAGEYLFVASAPTLVREALAVRGGTNPGLKQTAEFQALQKFLPTTGNQLTYVSRRFTEAVIDIQRQAIGSEKELKPAQMQLIEKLFFSQKATYGMTVGTHLPTGWQTVSVANHDASASLLAAPVAGVALGGAMLLPALAKAKEKAQSITCVNNMKQVNLALRIWAVDHDDQFPFNVNTAKGGTREFCERDAEGYDRNVARHFKVMANELNTPKILVCPTDKSKQAVEDFESLEAWNVSYQLRTGNQVNEANPAELVIYCPIHHHKGLADGSVQAAPRK